MNNPEVDEPEVIQNLMHIDLSIRKKGFKQLKSQWIIKYREFLWKAIENEKNKSFQAEMVEFALLTLKDRSLRKMIRFVEKGQLFPKARKHLVSSYLEYETEMVREALIKSLKRPGSQTYRFLTFLLRDDFLLEVWHEGQIRQLIQDILDPDIPITDRKVLIITIMNRYLSDFSFHNYLQHDIWDIVEKFPSIHASVLRLFFHPSYEETNYKIKPRRKCRLLWQNWTWVIPGTKQSYNEYPDLLTEYDTFLLRSRLSRDEDVRKAFIEIMATFSDITPNNQMLDDTYIENLDFIWSIVVQYDWEVKLRELDEITEESIENTFPEPIFVDGEEIGFLELLQLYQINPHDIIARLWATLPRSTLLSLAEHDPQVRNRIEAVLAMKQSGFYSMNNEDNRLWGPSQFWYALLRRSIAALKFEENSEMYDAVTGLVFKLFSILDNAEPKSLRQRIDEKIAILQTQIAELEDLEYTFPVYYKVNRYLTNKILELDSEIQLTLYQRECLVQEFVNALSTDLMYENLITLIDQQPYELQALVIETVDNLVETSTEIEELIKYLQQSDDVRIRTKAHLLEQKIKHY